MYRISIEDLLQAIQFVHMSGEGSDDSLCGFSQETETPRSHDEDLESVFTLCVLSRFDAVKCDSVTRRKLLFFTTIVKFFRERDSEG